MSTKPKRSYRVLCSLLAAMLITTTYGQHTKKVSFSKHRNKSARPYTIKTNYPTTGIAAAINTRDSFEGAWIAANSDTLFLKADSHGAEHNDLRHSNLFTISQAVEAFTFYPGSIQGEVRFTFIDARMPADVPAPRATKKKSAGCSEPAMIDQSEWRVDLSAPDYERIPNPVHNLIVHHSAGSNIDTNYPLVVRNIYVYHTEGRGWSDIGYNYIIAQDGSIFKGRDPDTLQQDSVMGAHFCASNSGTLGICMLGDYTNIIPSDTALSSLVHLLNWQAGKQGIDPTGQHPHSLNAALPVIAGHRDGCATECPGTQLYALLGNIRTATHDAFTGCNFSVNYQESASATPAFAQVATEKGSVIISHQSPVSVQFFSLMGIPVEAEQLFLSDTKSTYRLKTNTKGLIVVSISHQSKTHTQLIYLH